MTKEQLTKAFRELNKTGYFAVRNLACCRSCAGCEIPDKNKNMYVYTTTQGDREIFKGRTLHEAEHIYLYWSAPEDSPNEIVKILRKHGLKVTKPKNCQIAIKIKIIQ